MVTSQVLLSARFTFSSLVFRVGGPCCGTLAHPLCEVSVTVHCGVLVAKDDPHVRVSLSAHEFSQRRTFSSEESRSGVAEIMKTEPERQSRHCFAYVAPDVPPPGVRQRHNAFDARGQNRCFGLWRNIGLEMSFQPLDHDARDTDRRGCWDEYLGRIK